MHHTLVIYVRAGRSTGSTTVALVYTKRASSVLAEPGVRIEVPGRAAGPRRRVEARRQHNSAIHAVEAI